MANDLIAFGTWVRLRRHALVLTREDLAGRVGCAEVTIRKIEADERKPSPQIAELLATHLGVPAEQRDLFVRVARGLLAVEHLPPPFLGALPLQIVHHKDTEAQRTVPARSAGNLPSQVSSFHGREREINNLHALLNRTDLRLVTLTGPGGTGKTRLALQIGSERLDQYADGVWFVDLSPISDPQQIAAAIAQVLGIPESPERPIRAGVLNWLRERHTMLILDNCEQVIAGAADLVAELLRSSARLTVLATSRIPLRITAEQEYAVAPLGLPAPGVLPPLDQISQYDAVALFIHRARAVRADFTVTNANAPAVAEICIRLDGLPLAIELAAARIRLFAPEQLLQRLIAARMQILSGGTRDMPTRQQTIRATIDWSYRLLTPTQQTLLARLGVFVGGWTLEAAETIGDFRLTIAAICEPGGAAHRATDMHADIISNPPINIVNLLEALVEQSLVRFQETDGEPRYTMLETIREYALERLAERGETEQIQQQHAEYFAGFAEEAEPKMRSAKQMEWLARLEADDENISASLGWAFDTSSANTAKHIIGLRLASALWYYWLLHGRITTALPWLNSPLARSVILPKRLRAQVLVQAAWLQQSSYGSNSALAAQLAQEGLQLAREIRDKECTMMAAIVLIRNDVLSRKHKNIIEEVKAIARSSTSRWWLAHTLIAFSQADALNNLVTAQIECEEGLVLAREVGDAWLLISAIVSWVRLLGSTEGRSRALIAECIELARQVGDWLGLTQSLKLLAQEATYRGDFAVAQKLFEERLQAQRFLGNMPGIVGALVDIGHLAHRVGNLKGAERVMYEALALAPLGHDQRSVAGVEIMVRVCLDRGEYERAQLYADQALTVARGYDDVHAIGHFLWLSAYAYTICGDLAQAHRSLDELFRIAQQTGIAYIRGFYLEIEGMVALQHHDLGHARNMLEECIGLRRKLGEPEAVNVIWATFQLSCTEAVAGNYERASKLMHQCLQFHRQAPFAVDLPLMFEATAKLLVDTSHNSQIAARLWGAAEVLREQIGAPMWPVDRPEYERRVAEARAQIGSEEWEVAWAAGRTLSWEQAADQALAWMRRSPADLFGLSHP